MIKDRVYKIGLAVILALGILFRCYVFLRNQSLWCDEVHLAFNIYEKSYWELLRGLDRMQAAPPGFSIASKLLLNIFNPATDYYRDMVLRIIPFVSGLCTIPAFYYFSKLVFNNKKYMLWSLLLFNLNPCAIIYCAQFKQYSTELLCSIILLIIFYKIIAQEKLKPAYSFVIALIPWFSYSSFFIIASGFLVLFIKNRKSATKTVIPFVFSGVIYYLISLKFVFGLNYNSMEEFWSRTYGFLSLTHPLRFFIRFGELFAAGKFLSVISGLIVLGFFFWYCIAKSDLHKKLLLIVPVVLLIFASLVHKYAVQPRLILFVLPCFIIMLSSIENRAANTIKILLALIMIHSLPNYYPEQTGFSYSYAREAAAYLKNNLKKSDKIILNHDYTDYEIYLNKIGIQPSDTIIIHCSTLDIESCHNALKMLPPGSYYFLSIIPGAKEMTKVDGFAVKDLNLDFKPKQCKAVYFEKKF